MLPDPQDIDHVKRSLSSQPLLQRLTRHEGHHEIRRVIVRIDRVNRDNMLVDDGRRRLCLASEPPSRGGTRRTVRVQYLHGDVPIEFVVVALQHDPHPAAADQFENFKLTEPPEHRGVVALRKEVERDGSDGVVSSLSRRVGPARFVRRPTIRVCWRIVVGRRGDAPLVPPYGLFLHTGEHLARLTPPTRIGRERIELLAAGLTRFDMHGHGRLIRIRQPAVEQPLQPLAITVLLFRHHDGRLLLSVAHPQPHRACPDGIRSLHY